MNGFQSFLHVNKDFVTWIEMENMTDISANYKTPVKILPQLCEWCSNANNTSLHYLIVSDKQDIHKISEVGEKRLKMWVKRYSQSYFKDV